MMRRVVCSVLNLFVIMLHSKLVSSQLPSDQVSAMTSVYDILQNNTAPSFVWNNVLKASNPCSWRGVGCTPDNSSINTISFEFFSISTSEFLPFLCNISTLESLDVSENHLSSIPNAFITNCGGISGLKILNFSGNSFIGPLPTFSGFAMLEYLDFSRNSFSGEISLQLDELGSLKSLSNAFSLGSEPTRHQAPDAGSSTEGGILKNVSRTKAYRRGYGSLARGRDSRDWHKEDRRRSAMDNIRSIVARINNKSFFNKSRSASGDRGNGLHNEAGRDELKMFEAKYEASLKIHGGHKQQSVDADEYDDGMEFVADVLEDLDDGKERSSSTIPRSTDTIESSHANRVEDEKRDVVEEADNDVSDLYEETPPDPKSSGVESHSQRTEGQPARRLIPESRTKKKPKNRKVAAATCTMRILNSTATLLEPLESRNFANFLLQYVEKEDKPINKEKWEPRFSGHQTLKEREDSFIARDQNIKCGFVNGHDGSSTGFDLDEDDAKYISSCHIAVSSCIFGNSDRLRSPMGKTVSRLSKKYVCFIMFVDEATLQTLSSEGKMRDEMGFIGLWKVVVVKNLPYSDMRRVRKIPKLLPHRLFPSARYSIWLDSKLRLTLDPLLILEYFLWRKGYEYAISNHYDRHCLWEEVAQNKRLNKYNHSVIDEQFRFYQSDGMRRFNASDPDKLLPSNVPEGSFIVRAHTPMSNLFSCLWFNEVDRFTPRDQLSFAYTYYKLSRMNPGKPFYLNMFKDCERRKIAKLYRHRSEEKRASSHIDL